MSSNTEKLTGHSRANNLGRADQLRLEAVAAVEASGVASFEVAIEAVDPNPY
jgi:hypothetical protein